MGGRVYGRSVSDRKSGHRGWWYLDRVPRIRSWVLVAGAIFFYLEASLVPAMIFSLDSIQALFIGNLLTGVILFLLYRCHRFGIQDPVPKTVFRTRTFIKWSIIFVGACMLLEPLFHFLDTRVADSGMDARADAISGNVLLFAFVSIFLAPLVEEIMMRLFCYNVLRASCSRFTATVGSAMVFGFMHGTVSHMVVATLLGCILAFSYEATGIWWVPVMGHYIYNTMVLFFFNDVMLSVTELPGFFLADVAAVSILLFFTGCQVYGQNRKR